MILTYFFFTSHNRSITSHYDYESVYILISASHLTLNLGHKQYITAFLSYAITYENNLEFTF